MAGYSYEIYVTGGNEPVFESEHRKGNMDEANQFLASKMAHGDFIQFRHENGECVVIQKINITHIKIYDETYAYKGQFEEK
ncbi:hypothetical protein [Alkalicoccobacillus plakortidis]|uniref:Phage protein n=1 Tax=Alkalicoccobacillus plakortidis TaxID=444060 RepID=A0ABT0XDU8_9BACI|nr:hypothetical protein [Alkalicoccobacillus plakortidis]MCM2674076.1 hypothetical protein [Alkalicoccobacillus plakortidis]